MKIIILSLLLFLGCGDAPDIPSFLSTDGLVSCTIIREFSDSATGDSRRSAPPFHICRTSKTNTWFICIREPGDKGWVNCLNLAHVKTVQNLGQAEKGSSNGDQ